MPHEFSEFANVFRSEPNAWNVTGPSEIGKEFGVSPTGLVGSLFHSRDVTGMSEFDGPFGFFDESFGKFRDSGAGFDGGVDIGTEGSDDTDDGLGIVFDGLVE